MQVLLKVIDGMTIDIALQVRVEEVFFFLLLRPGKNSKTPTNSLSDPFSLSPSLSPFFLTSESSSSLQKKQFTNSGNAGGQRQRHRRRRRGRCAARGREVLRRAEELRPRELYRASGREGGGRRRSRGRGRRRGCLDWRGLFLVPSSVLAVLASPRSRRGALERLNVKPRERETEKQKSEEGGVYTSSDRSRQKKKKKKVFAFLFAHSLPFSSCLTSDAPHARPGDRARGRVVVVAEGERRECGRNGDGEEGDTGGGSSGDDEATTANNSLGLQHLVLLRELHRPVAPRRGCSLGFDLLQQERYGGQLKRSGGGDLRAKEKSKSFFSSDGCYPSGKRTPLFGRLQALLCFPDRALLGAGRSLFSSPISPTRYEST